MISGRETRQPELVKDGSLCCTACCIEPQGRDNLEGRALQTPWFFETLPVRLLPQPLESFTSLLQRNAEANRLTSLIGLYEALTLSPEYRTPRSNGRLIDHAPLSWGQLPLVLDCPLSSLQATTFHYLMERFGRLAQPHQTGIFLSGSLAKSLRYCPQCLAEQSVPYYLLPWRFTFLVGCAKHTCMLLDACPQCTKAIPLLMAPFKVGFCPLCGGDLRLGERDPLPDTEQERVQHLTEDLAFLLSPPDEQREVSLSRTIVSQQMALLQHSALRQRNEPNLKERSEIATAWRTPHGYRRHDGALLWYVQVLRAIGITFRTLFDGSVLREHALLLKAVSASPPSLDREMTALLQGIPDRLARIQQRLQKQGLKITEQDIEEHVRLPLKLLTPYPEIQSIIAHIIREVAPPARKQKDLSTQGYPKVKLQPPAPETHMWRKARDRDLFRQVQKAIWHLERRGQAVTCMAVCKLTSHNYMTLTSTRYPRTRQRMQELSERKNARMALLREQREEGLLRQVQQARKALEFAGQTVTVKTVAKAVGLHPVSLRAYSRVKDELARIASDNQKYYRQERQRQEEMFLARIDAHLQQCREQGHPIIQSHISQKLGISLATLLGYPRIKERFMQIRAVQKQGTNK